MRAAAAHNKLSRPQVALPVSRRQRSDTLTDSGQTAGPPASDTVDTLLLDLLEWIGPEPRPYTEVLEAWRTSCLRLPIWEGVNDRGFIAHHREPGRGAHVSVSAAGTEHLRRHRQARGADGRPR
jgi:hypothetical protein